jgi:Second Messenger Oligonucleotide or Dinucleotide Synthetase domain
MSVSTRFQSFCANIRIPLHTKNSISYKYQRITSQLNTDFWNTNSETAHSLYVGSYGRDTDIHISDIDMLFQLPSSMYTRINSYSSNKQSALLQEVRNSIQKTFPKTYISGDGQVIKIKFTSGIIFEIVPCFLNDTSSYIFPDTNNGGRWKTTNPKPEIEAIRAFSNTWGDNLKDLCRMMRVWKDQWSVPIGGLLIDTLAYNFLKNWKYRDKSYSFYDFMVQDFFEYLKDQDQAKTHWLSLGSGQYLLREGIFEHKALRCYNLATEAVDCECDNKPVLAKVKWQAIFGSKFNV